MNGVLAANTWSRGPPRLIKDLRVSSRVANFLSTDCHGSRRSAKQKYVSKFLRSRVSLYDSHCVLLSRIQVTAFVNSLLPAALRVTKTRNDNPCVSNDSYKKAVFYGTGFFFMNHWTLAQGNGTRLKLLTQSELQTLVGELIQVIECMQQYGTLSMYFGITRRTLREEDLRWITRRAWSQSTSPPDCQEG